MVTIFDTARYILEKQGRLSTIKLQRLCFYSQAWSLVWDDMPLFEEDFEAWANGPICTVLYEKFKGRFDLYAEDISGGDSSKLSDQQKENVDKVLDFFGHYNIQHLSRLTHVEDPWKKAREGCLPEEGCNEVISKASMALYYGGLDSD